MTRRYHRHCEECGLRSYCREDRDGLMTCEDCKVKLQCAECEAPKLLARLESTPRAPFPDAYRIGVCWVDGYIQNDRGVTVGTYNGHNMTEGSSSGLKYDMKFNVDCFSVDDIGAHYWHEFKRDMRSLGFTFRAEFFEDDPYNWRDS